MHTYTCTKDRPATPAGVKSASFLYLDFQHARTHEIALPDGPEARREDPMLPGLAKL
jgi:hypothetical protein